MKIAVTGANGFVGSGLLSRLSAWSYEPVALIRKSASFAPLKGVETRIVDYSQPSSILEAISDVDILIHNAGSTKALTYAQIYESNVQVTRQVLRAVNQSPSVFQFILISSQAASRPSLNGVAVTEDQPCAPVTWYGKSKQRAEELVRKECGKNWTIIRPCPIYGPGDKDFLALARLIGKGLNIRIGSRDKAVNMIFIDELANLIELCFANKKAYGEVFFATDGISYTQGEITDLMAQAIGRKAYAVTIPDAAAKLIFSLGELIGRVSGRPLVINKQKQNEIMAEGWLCSINKAQNLLGFNPEADLKAHIEETISWYKESSWL